MNPYLAPRLETDTKPARKADWPTRWQLFFIAAGIACLVFSFCDFMTAELFRQQVVVNNPPDLNINQLLMGPIRGIASACLGLMLIQCSFAREPSEMNESEQIAPNDSVEFGG